MRRSSDWASKPWIWCQLSTVVAGRGIPATFPSEGCVPAVVRAMGSGDETAVQLVPPGEQTGDWVLVWQRET